MFRKIKNYYNKKNIKDKKYLYMFDECVSDEYVCFDCETTGLNPKIDDIISIGAVKIENNTILSSQKFERFVNLTTHLDENSIKIHHIRECDLLDGVQIKHAIDEFLDFIGNKILVGYYLSFDIAMINKYIFSFYGFKLPNKTIEVSELYYDYKQETIPQGHIDLRFDTIIKDLNLPLFSQHDASNDALMASMMFLKLKNMPKK